MNSSKPGTRPWSWLPTLYLAEGLPYVLVMSVSVIFYKKMGVSNAKIGLYTSLLYLPWVIKPLWSPIVDMLLTKRIWILAMQGALCLSIFGIAATTQVTMFFPITLIFFWILAFSSATHDIAVDGFYMLALSKRDQAFFVGIRSTFYRLAMITGQGLLVMLAGWLETETGQTDRAWMITFAALAIGFALFFVTHTLILPKPPTDFKREVQETDTWLHLLWTPFASFFKKKGLGPALAFLLLYRLSEAQLVKMTAPFLLDPREAGGLGLQTAQVGWIYGTVGLTCLIIGGILGGIAVARKGFGFWLWWMVAAINVPNAVYVYMSMIQPQAGWVIHLCVAFEQFGYGFGFTAYMLYMIARSDGPHKTAHFAICTGFMAVGMMLPGMPSGWLQSIMGYQGFFIWVLLSAIPAFLAARAIDITDDFGKK